MIEKDLFQVKLTFKNKLIMKSFVSLDNSESHGDSNLSFNQLYALTILVIAPQCRPDPPPPFTYRSNLILFGHINN